MKDIKEKPRLFARIIESIYGAKPENVYLVLAITFGVIAAIVIPPMAVADEIAHYINALKVSHGQFLPSVKNGETGIFMSYIEAQFLDYHSIDVMSPKMKLSDIFMFSSGSNAPTLFYESDMVGINPFAYLVSGVGLAIVRFLFPFFNAHICFIFARFCNLAVAVIITRHAIKVTPVLKNTMLMLALMPMTLHQIASLSYDALLIPVAFLFFAYVMKIVYEKCGDYKITINDIAILCFCCAVLFGIKFVYGAMAVVLFAIPKRKVGSWKKYFILGGIILLLIAVFYYLPTKMTSLVTSPFSNKNPLSAENRRIFYSDVFHMVPRILKDTTLLFLRIWRTQFFGSLGWLTLRFPFAFEAVFYIILAVVFLTDVCRAGGISVLARFLSAAAFSLVFAGAILGIYLRHNPSVGYVGGTIAYGVQGRYFIPSALFGLVVFSNSLLEKCKYKNVISLVGQKLSYVTVLFYSAATVVLLFSHFWV